MFRYTFALVVLLSALALGQTAPAPNNYADPKTWLCRPGQHDACDIDNTTTIVTAQGKLSRETWKAVPNAPIDCFYVYPRGRGSCRCWAWDRSKPSDRRRSNRWARWGRPSTFRG